MWYVSVVRPFVCLSVTLVRRVEIDRLSALSWFLTPMPHSAWLGGPGVPTLGRDQDDLGDFHKSDKYF